MMVTDEDFVFHGLLDTQPASESRMGQGLQSPHRQMAMSAPAPNKA
jgi:hypothetical protein